jgi:hypothetical protein
MNFEKVLALFAALHDHKVEYILVGALGMTVHGIVRATQDIDLFVRPDGKNIERLREALHSVIPEDPSIYEITAEDLAGEFPAIRYNSPDGQLAIDFLARLGQAFSYKDLPFEERHYEGIPVRVATPRALYLMKKDTVRPQDRADAQVLKEEFDLED